MTAEGKRVEDMEVYDLRLRQLEVAVTKIDGKVDELLKCLNKMVELDLHYKQVRRDLDALGELIRAHASLHATQTQHNARIEQLLSGLPDLIRAISDPDRGLSVRVTRLEGALDTQQRSHRNVVVVATTLVLGSLSAVVAWAWARITG